MIYRYMKAHIRNNRIDPTGWSPQDIEDSFLLLPEPRVSYDAWASVREQPEEPQELTKEEMLKANDKAFEKLKALNG